MQPTRVPAAIVSAPGAEPELGLVDLPERTPGTTILKVLAAPLNPLDLLIASGNFHSARHESPYVPGSECVGVVIESQSFAPGTRVYAECTASPATSGSFASHLVVSDENIVPFPKKLDAARGAAIGNSGVAAFIPLIETAELKAGETVLILGATGAVGRLAVQIAHLRGAGRVIGVGRSHAALGKVGADAVVELREGESVDELAIRLRAVTGEVNVVLDGLYGVPFEAALQVCASRARVVNIGNSFSPTASIPAGLLRGKQITLTGFAGLHVPLPIKVPALTWLWDALGTGTLSVPITTITLAELPAAWRSQAHSPHSKFVVVHPESSIEGS